MATQAKVDSLEALQRLRAAIVRFSEVVGAVVADASADVSRTLQWLELDRSHHWEVERRRRHERLQQALEALRMKQLFKGPAGERPSTVDEEKRVKQCRAELEEAETKIRLVASHRTKLSREALLFQGVLSRLGGISVHSAPAAIAELSNLLLAIEKYGALAVEARSQAPVVGVDDVGRAADAVSASMTRPSDTAADEAEPVQLRSAVAGSGVAAGASSALGPGDATAARSGHGSADGSTAAAETDWALVRRRARDAWSKFAQAVVVERAALAAGARRAVVLRDFLRGRVFVTTGDRPESVAGVDVSRVDATACEGWTLEQLIDWSPGLENVLSSPGDIRAVVTDGGRVVTVVKDGPDGVSFQRG